VSLGFKRDIAEAVPIKFAKILLELVFAWGISSVICMGGNFAASIVSNSSALRPADPPELITAVIAILQYGSGAFCLGTLAKKTNIWLLAILFVLPLLLLLPNTATSFPALTKPLISVALCFIGSLCAIAAGQSTPFNRAQAALNIPWYHWLWLFPTSLFQAVCVPLTLLFVFFQFDEIYSIVDGRIIFRFVIAILLPLFLVVIYHAGKILASPARLTVVEKLALFFSWLFLTIPTALMMVIQAGKDMMY
jgi:hypothetical protein